MSDDLAVPEGWSRTTLGSIGRYLNGRAFKTSEWSKTGRPIIRIQDLTGSNRNPNYFEGEVEDRYVVRPGDFLISWSATLGAYIWDGPEGVLNQHIFKVESNVNKRFHYHLVRERIAELERNAHGSGMVHVTKGVFEETPVAVPDDPDTQRQLAEIIDQADAMRISSASHLAGARRAIERFRQAVLAAACSGLLTSDWRESEGGRGESALQLIEHSLNSIEVSARRKRSDDDWSEPDWLELPDEWAWAPMRDLAQIRGGIQKQPKRAPKSNSYPYLRVANVQRGRLDLSEIHRFELFDGELGTYRLEPGDLLVVEGNGSPTEIGRAAVWAGEIHDCVHQNHIIRVRCVEMHPRFVELFWNSPLGAREIAALAVTSAGLYSLSTKKIGAVPVPVAPLDEQREIVRRAVQLLQLADVLRSRIDAASKRLDRSSQAVLAKAFRGELGLELRGAGSG